MTPSTQVVKEEQPSRPWVLFSLLFFPYCIHISQDAWLEIDADEGFEKT